MSRPSQHDVTRVIDDFNRRRRRVQAGTVRGTTDMEITDSSTGMDMTIAAEVIVHWSYELFYSQVVNYVIHVRHPDYGAYTLDERAAAVIRNPAITEVIQKARQAVSRSQWRKLYGDQPDTYEHTAKEPNTRTGLYNPIKIK